MQTKIKQLLSQKDISQREVAERMGISPQSLACRLKAEDISLSTLNGIADAMDIELSHLCAMLEGKSLTEHKTIESLREENAALRKLIHEQTKVITLLTK